MQLLCVSCVQNKHDRNAGYCVSCVFAALVIMALQNLETFVTLNKLCLLVIYYAAIHFIKFVSSVIR